MRNSPLVSIVVCLWRHDRYLFDAVNSIMSQTYKNIEIVFVDNNASEKVLRTASSFLTSKSDISMRIISEPIQGIASARSRGVIEARGEFVGFLDSDDLMYPERIEKQVEVLRKFPQASMVVCQYDFVSNDGKRVLRKGWIPRPEMWAKLLIGKGSDFGYPFYDSHPSTMLFSRKIALDAGLFNAIFNPFWYEDSEFSLRMHFIGPIKCINQSLSAIRQTSSEYRDSREGKVDWVRFVNTQHFFTILRQNFNGNSETNKKSFSKIRSRWLMEQSSVYFRSKDGESLGKKMIIRGLKEYPLRIKNLNYLLDIFSSHPSNINGSEIPEKFKSVEFVQNYLA